MSSGAKKFTGSTSDIESGDGVTASHHQATAHHRSLTERCVGQLIPPIPHSFSSTSYEDDQQQSCKSDTAHFYRYRPTQSKYSLMRRWDNDESNRKNNSFNNHERFRLRPIQPTDKDCIRQLHEDWFPVTYQDDFYEELVHGRMTGTGDPLFTLVATITQDVEPSAYVNVGCSSSSGSSMRNLMQQTETTTRDAIIACVVGSFVDACRLSRSTQDLLINCRSTHPRMFYLMTVGTVQSHRHYGLGSYMIQQCEEQVRADTGCGVLYLHVHIENRAATRMYEKLGFHRVQEIPNYYKIDDVPHNCYLYAKYFHGNRGHRAMYKLFWSALHEFWQILVGSMPLLINFLSDSDRRDQ